MIHPSNAFSCRKTEKAIKTKNFRGIFPCLLWHKHCLYKSQRLETIEIILKFMRPVKHFEKGLTYVASGLFNAVKSVNQFKPNPSFTPKWSDKPLLKSWQKSKPTLGFPRMTDSLCPNCVIEARESIISGEKDVSILVNEKVGEIKAQIIERNGEIWMVKDCPK